MTGDFTYPNLRKIDPLLQANQWLNRKVGTTFSVEWLESGAGCDDLELVFGDAHALGHDDAEAVEECGLVGIGLGDTSQADLAVGGGRQHHVVRLDACKLFEDRAR